ncbi:hypothetical protein PENSPDRAFT_671009 [Peniophora sp. CONT]|nr:hypothetical protein PENSPDRAFT_671009 [Peniophora sp. CONT]
MANPPPVSYARPGSMNVTERHISRLDYYLPSTRLSSLVRWVQPTPTGPHGVLPDGDRILAKNVLRPTEVTLTVVGDVAPGGFFLRPGYHFDGEAGISWPDLMSSFQLEAPRHVAFSGHWERALYNMNFILESSVYADNALHTTLDPLCLDLQQSKMMFGHRYIREIGDGESRADPVLNDTHLDPRLNSGNDVLAHYLPENWGVEDVHAEQELIEYAHDPEYCVRLLPLYVSGGRHQPLQPRHYNRLPGSLVRVDFTVLDTAETQNRQQRALRTHTLQAIVSSIQVLLPRGYNRFTSSTWDGNDLNWT